MNSQTIQFQSANNIIFDANKRVASASDFDFPRSLVDADARLSRTSSETIAREDARNSSKDGVNAAKSSEQPEKTTDRGNAETRDDTASARDINQRADDSRDASATGDASEKNDESSSSDDTAAQVDDNPGDDQSINDGESSDEGETNVVIDGQLFEQAVATTTADAEKTGGESEQTQQAVQESGKSNLLQNQVQRGQQLKQDDQSQPRDNAQASIDAAKVEPHAKPAPAVEVTTSHEVVADTQQTAQAKESNNNVNTAARVEPTVQSIDNAGALQTDTSGANSSGKSVVPPVPQAQLSDADAEAALQRVTRGLQTAVNQKGGTVTLRLHPPELGFVRIEMEIVNGVVRASMQSDAANVRHLLSQQVAQLRAGLEQQGLSVERLNVQGLPQVNTGNQTQTSTDSQSQNGAARESFGDGRSRGQFQHQDQSNQNNDESSRQETRRQQRGLRFNDALFGQLGN